jgi:hypothetical protein
MTDCPSPWSGQDEFLLYDDCHVWVPLYRLFYAVICVVALVDFVLGYLRVSQGKGLFSICLTAYSFWLAIACGIRLTTGWVIGDRNVALNMTCALTLVFFWCGLSLYVLKYLDFLFQTERLRGRSEGILGRARQILYGFMVCAFILQIVNLVVPTLSQSDFLPTLWITIYFQATFLSLLFLYYGFKARLLLQSISHAGETYQILRQRLDFVLIPWTLGYICCTVIIALLLFAGVFVRNQYILMPFTWLIEALIACSILIATRDSALGSVELMDTTQSPQLVSGAPGLEACENSGLSDSQSQGRSEHSGLSGTSHGSRNTSATATPNLPDRMLRFSPVLETTPSDMPHGLLDNDLNLNFAGRPSGLQSFRDLEVGTKFHFRPFGLNTKGMSRLEEGEWVSSEEMILTIDTTDRNPKPITLIDSEDLTVDY